RKGLSPLQLRKGGANVGFLIAPKTHGAFEAGTRFFGWENASPARARTLPQVDFHHVRALEPSLVHPVTPVVLDDELACFLPFFLEDRTFAGVGRCAG